MLKPRSEPARAARIAGARAQAERGELHEDRDARHIRRLGPQADTTKGGRRPRSPARQHLSGVGRPRTSLQPSPTLTGLRPSSQEEKDPPPEKYSVEWYLERARETERSKATPDASRSGGSVAALALLAAASTAALVLF